LCNKGPRTMSEWPQQIEKRGGEDGQKKNTTVLLGEKWRKTKRPWRGWGPETKKPRTTMSCNGCKMEEEDREKEKKWKKSWS